MKKITKRLAVTSSVVVAVVLGAGGAASATSSDSMSLQRPPASVKADGNRWDHGVGYLFDLGYTRDEIRGLYGDRLADAARQ
ncbi:hypothetical protein [Streptomyces sp. AM8-1-1]|uniref:hypothetical protein n=1 Tax=Streptomyces sp. AM8-1-1 TaxID=3075825 RepID=UPI0028C4933A|nr:hypothetical protein [Streptomyces sp. AM8-1-1]WNO76867.1 hypothetical protein RPQ07_36955 [Streptomyces sp. AM8-1-1]